MAAVSRKAHLRILARLLRENPVVALLGARQVGKTTLARELMRQRRGPATWFDLERPRDLRQLDEPTLTLEPLRGLVVLDEIQNRPELFPVLRVLADRSPRPARFLVLGSASPELLRQGSETLAGRIAFHELPGFDLAESDARQGSRSPHAGVAGRVEAARLRSVQLSQVPERGFLRGGTRLRRV